jgi:hypothetical protein
VQVDFLKAQAGRVWVPVTISIDSSKLSNPSGGPAALYLRVVPRGMSTPPPTPAPSSEKQQKKKGKDKDAATPAENASPYPISDGAMLDLKPAAPGQTVYLRRGFDIAAGQYDFYVVVKERTSSGAAGKAAVLKRPLDVPNYQSGELTTSSVILASNLETLPAAAPIEQQIEHPYTMGTVQITVPPDHTFRKAQELIVIFQIYNPTIAPDKKFNLEATYTFYRQGPDGEKRFNATEPQPFTPEHSIQAGQGIPLQSFPEGTYRLEIKVTDKLANPAKVLTHNVNFTVTS